MKKSSDTLTNATALSCPDSNQYKHRPTKLELVLGYLIQNRSITPREALTHCNCWRLAAVIHSLKKSGICIHTQQEPHQGGFHARYHLDDPDAALRHHQRLTKRSDKSQEAAA